MIMHNNYCHFLVHCWNKGRVLKLKQHFFLHNWAGAKRKKRMTHVEKFPKIKVTELGEVKKGINPSHSWLGKGQVKENLDL